MKMHPKPLRRHIHHVEPVTGRVTYEPGNPVEPFHITFTRDDGLTTQRLTMTECEARTLIRELSIAVILQDVPARYLTPEDWEKINALLLGDQTVTVGVQNAPRHS